MSSHSQASGSVQIDDPEPGSTWFVSLTGSIIFLAIVLALCAMYFQVQGTFEAAVVSGVPVTAVENAKTAQMIKLVSPGPWVEESFDEKGNVIRTDRTRISIGDAMKIVGAELSGAPAPAPASAGGGAK